MENPRLYSSKSEISRGAREQRQGACITRKNLMITTELNQTSHTCVISLLHLTSLTAPATFSPPYLSYAQYPATHAEIILVTDSPYGASTGHMHTQTYMHTHNNWETKMPLGL